MLPTSDHYERAAQSAEGETMNTLAFASRGEELPAWPLRLSQQASVSGLPPLLQLPSEA